jgi:hypothetical protein
MARVGLRLSFTEVFTHSTIFFRGKPARLRSGESLDDANRRRTWDVLENWEPRVEGVNRRLVVREAEGENTKTVSELLGEAIALSVAQRVLRVPFRYWNKRTYQKGTRHDFDAVARGKTVYAEARGRFNGNNNYNAVTGALRKFDALQSDSRRTFSRMIGVVYNLRTSADDQEFSVPHDVVVVDPRAPSRPPDPLDRWRSLAAHYSTFFAFQGMDRAARVLSRLVRLSDNALLEAVRSRSPTLPISTRREPNFWGRATIKVNSREYRGTFWMSSKVPAAISSATRQGEPRPVFWGLDSSVIQSLSVSALDEVDEMEASPWNGQLDGYAYSHADNGGLFAWSHSRRSLLNHP